MSRRPFAVVALLVAALAATAAPAQAAPPTGTAADGPGASRTSTSPARTASARPATGTSKVWYTVADGVLSDVYYPTIDNTNVETLQYVVTDGSTFTDLQTRDMTYTVESLDRPGAGLPGHEHGARAAATGSSPTTSPTRAAPASSCAPGFKALQRQRPRLPALRPLRPDAQRQRRRRRPANGGADSGAVATRPRPHRARRLGHRHRDQRRQPRLRAARVHARCDADRAVPRRSPTATPARRATA